MRKQSGRYYARFYDRSRSPKRKSWPLRTHRKDVAGRKLTELKRAYEEGEFDPWEGGWLRESRTVPEAADAFLEAKKEAGLRPNMIEVYHYVLKGLKKHTPPGAMVRDAAPEHVRSHVHAPKEVAGKEEEVSNATKRHRHSHLSTLFRWAAEAGSGDATIQVLRSESEASPPERLVIALVPAHDGVLAHDERCPAKGDLRDPGAHDDSDYGAVQPPLTRCNGASDGRHLRFLTPRNAVPNIFPSPLRFAAISFHFSQDWEAPLK